MLSAAAAAADDVDARYAADAYFDITPCQLLLFSPDAPAHAADFDDIYAMILIVPLLLCHAFVYARFDYAFADDIAFSHSLRHAAILILCHFIRRLFIFDFFFAPCRAAEHSDFLHFF